MREILLVSVMLIIFQNGVSQISNEKIEELLILEAKKINKDLNDTFRYDFMVCPELIAWTKWDFVFNININNQRLIRKLNKSGITDDKVIRFIRTITFHRILNQKDIDLSDQLKIFKKYADLIKSKNPNTFWKLTNDTPYLKIYNNYISKIKKNIKVSGFLNTKSSEHTWVHNLIDYEGEFIKTKDKNIIVKVHWIDQPLDGYKLINDVQMNDSIIVNPLDVTLIPR